jgi:hypothetical protein
MSTLPSLFSSLARGERDAPLTGPLNGQTKTQVDAWNKELASVCKNAYEAGETAQMERDCIAVCLDCRKGRPLDGDMHVWNGGAWAGERVYENRMRCQAANIRSAWAERAAQEGQEKT